MNASLYLKRKLLAERKIAASLESGIKQSFISAAETLNDVYAGMERASWYTSCLSDKYQSSCQELKAEDMRMIKAIMAIYKHKDIISEIFSLYIDYALRNSTRTQGQALTIQVAEFTAESVAGKSAKKAMAYSLAKLIAESALIKITIRKSLNTISFHGFSIAQFYGKIQKSVMAARRLKALEPNFFKVLYQAEIEMLYIYVEPVLSKLIKEINATQQYDTEEVLKVLKRYQS